MNVGQSLHARASIVENVGRSSRDVRRIAGCDAERSSDARQGDRDNSEPARYRIHKMLASVGLEPTTPAPPD